MTPADESTLPDDTRPPGDDPAGATEPGQVLRDRYVLEEHVATGATSAVWRGFDRQLMRTIAVKILDVDDATRDAAAARFRREAVTAARLPHPGIVAVYDTGTDGGTTWLALEHVDGPDLLTVLRHNPSGLPDTTAAAIVEQAAIALGVAHERGVVHRDVKPANLLMTRDGIVKVSDFGVAASVGQHVPLVTDSPVGTAAYAAPEQLVGDVEAAPRMDVFALGVVLYELLTGRAAFPSRGPANARDEPLRPRQVRADADRALDAVVQRATSPDADRRFRDAGQLAAALRALVPVEPHELAADAVATTMPQARQRAASPRITRPTSTASRLRWGALLLAVLISVGGAAAVLVDADQTDDDTGQVAADAGTAVRDVRLYDPYGRVDDDPGRLLEVVDGDPETGWRTPAYPRPLRTLGTPGVGVRIDLGQQVEVQDVRLALGIPGVTVELLAREERPASASTELDWTFVGRAADAGDAVTIEAGSRRARHWLVWFTSLTQTGETWQASLTDVRFTTDDV